MQRPIELNEADLFECERTGGIHSVSSIQSVPSKASGLQSIEDRFPEVQENAGVKRYWLCRELIVIGTFAAVSKITTFLIALAGGGMNPASLVLKNVVATTLLLLLVHKVRKFGVLSLFALVGGLVSILFMGGSAMSLGGMLVAAPLCDGLMFLLGRNRRPWALLVGIGCYDLLTRCFSLGFSYLYFRETPELLVMGFITVSLGYIGCILGLIGGALLVKEFKHACIIRE